MNKDEALKMAHKTFMQLNERSPRKEDGSGYFDIEIQACKEALEQHQILEAISKDVAKQQKDKQFYQSSLVDIVEQPAMTYEQGFAHGYEAHRVEQELKQTEKEPVDNYKIGYEHGKKYYLNKYYKGNSNQHWHNKAKAYSKALDDLWIVLKENGINADDGTSIVDIVKKHTHPAPSWQGLSDDEDDAIIQSIWSWGNDFPYDKYRVCIEQALRNKNG